MHRITRVYGLFATFAADETVVDKNITMDSRSPARLVHGATGTGTGRRR